jgi:hypothetical protein
VQQGGKKGCCQCTLGWALYGVSVMVDVATSMGGGLNLGAPSALSRSHASCQWHWHPLTLMAVQVFC